MKAFGYNLVKYYLPVRFTCTIYQVYYTYTIYLYDIPLRYTRTIYLYDIPVRYTCTIYLYDIPVRFTYIRDSPVWKHLANSIYHFGCVCVLFNRLNSIWSLYPQLLYYTQSKKDELNKKIKLTKLESIKRILILG